MDTPSAADPPPTDETTGFTPEEVTLEHHKLVVDIILSLEDVAEKHRDYENNLFLQIIHCIVLECLKTPASLRQDGAFEFRKYVQAPIVAFANTYVEQNFLLALVGRRIFHRLYQKKKATYRFQGHLV